MGIGMLSMPYAMRLGGWAGLAALAAALALFATSAHALVAALELLPPGAPNTYPALGAAAFGEKGATLVAFAALCEFGGGAVCTLAFAFAQAALLAPAASLATIAPAVLGATLPLLAVSSFKKLTPLSAIGNVSSAAVFVAVAACVFADPHRDAFAAAGDPTPTHHTAGWSIARSLGIFAVSVSGHSSLPALRASMADPSLFPSVLTASFSAMGFLYGGVALSGYWYYGDTAKQVATASLASDSPFGGVVKVRGFKITLDAAVGAAVLLNAVTTYPALVMIVQETLWAVANPWRGRRSGVAALPPRRLRAAPRLALRLAVASVSAAVSVGAYASIANALALLGGSSSMVASLLLPLAAYMRLAGRAGVLSNAQRGGLIALLIAGAGVTVAVVWQASADLLEDLRKKGHRAGFGQ